MSTICFDIKRVDSDYVCIQHCCSNKFEYEYHLGFSFYPRKRNGKEHWWLEDKKYRYVWILVGTNYVGIETIIWVCNDKVWLNNTMKMFKHDWSIYNNLRVIKLPFERKEKYTYNNNKEYYRYTENDMRDKFKLYCPTTLNEKNHVYADHYDVMSGWVAPKYLGEE